MTRYHRDPLTIRLPTNGVGKWNDGIAAATLLAHPLAGSDVQLLHLDAGAKEQTVIIGVRNRSFPPTAPDEAGDRTYIRDLVLRLWRGDGTVGRGIDTDVMKSGA